MSDLHGNRTNGMGGQDLWGIFHDSIHRNPGKHRPAKSVARARKVRVTDSHGNRKCPVCGCLIVRHVERFDGSDEITSFWQCMDPLCRQTFDTRTKRLVHEPTDARG